MDNYREFRQQRGAPISPLEAPETLPGMPEGLHPGELPTFEMLRKSLAEADIAALYPEVCHPDVCYAHWVSLLSVLKLHMA